MTQNNFRKEPRFGEPLTTVEENKTTGINNKPHISLHSNQAPSYTFTPVMMRPKESSEIPTPEEVEPTQKFQFTPDSNTTEGEEEAMESTRVTLNTTNDTELNESAVIKENVIKPDSEGLTTERILPNAAFSAATRANDNNTVEAKIQPKTRRLLLVALLVLALLVTFFLLKPSIPKSVEELQVQQGSSLPIEFRPVDEAEAKRAEEQARAKQEQEAKLLQEQQTQLVQQTQQNGNTQSSTASTNTIIQNEKIAGNQPQSVVGLVAEAVENKPVIKPASKPKVQSSAVYQSEEAKPQPKVQPKKVAVKSAPEKASTRGDVEVTKTMSVPKGVSLMQVFRDNNLNIADVNAMNKVNNALSNLKVGEKVTVRLDKNNRVVTMSIGSGGKFTRQANGSYTFK